MDIFDDFQRELIVRYGDNLHFLDAVLHMDEAVPHIHIRKVWTYHGKDGLDISQNKALEEMGFERPNPEKGINKWNNAKITFSEMERNLKLRICEDHGLSVEHTPLHPGKATMEKEEAELNEREKSLDKLETVIKEKITNFFNKFLMPIFKRFQAKHQLEVLSVLDQQMIDRSTAQKLHKIGYPNMEGRPFEDALDIAEERDIFDLVLKQHAPSLNTKT